MPSMTFTPLAVLPGWEATEGNFKLTPSGALIFVRYVRKAGDRLAHAILSDTPREFDRFIARSAVRFAEVAARVPA